MKRKSLKGTGLNGKGQGAGALLKGLRSQTQKSAAKTSQPLVKPQKQTTKPPKPDSQALKTAPVEEEAQALQQKTTKNLVETKTALAESKQIQTEAVSRSKKSKPVERKEQPPTSTLKASQLILETAEAETATEVKPQTFKQKKSLRKKCTYYIEPTLVKDLDRIEAQHTLRGQTVEKSDIVNEALRRYLPQVSQPLPQQDSAAQDTTRQKSSGRLKRTYYLEPGLEQALTHLQARYILQEQKIEKSTLINEALRRYLPQIKEDLQHSP